MSAIEELLETMAKLRSPEGCPWDQEQDHQSIAQCLVDECSELLETIDKLDMEHMREELGDVLLQVVFHSQLAKEERHFDFEAVAAEVNEKLVRRHPHVFGDTEADTSDKVLHQWEQIKAQEKANKPKSDSVFKDLPPSLPASLFAYDIFKQIVKNELPTGETVDRGLIDDLVASGDEESFGKRFFELAAACRLKGVDPESAMRKYARKVMAESEALSSNGQMPPEVTE